MRAFGDQLTADLDNVFFNLDEFAEPHQINSKAGVVCIFDDGSEKMKAGFTRYEGMEKGTATLLIRQNDVPGKIAVRQTISVDKTEYRIKNIDSTNGLYVLLLEAVR